MADALGLVSVCPGCGRVAAAFRDRDAEDIRVAYTGPAGEGASLERMDDRTVAMYVPCERCAGDAAGI